MDENRKIYDEAVAVLNNSDSIENLYDAIIQFESLEEFEDSSQKIRECKDKIERLKKLNKEEHIVDAKKKNVSKKRNTQEEENKNIVGYCGHNLCIYYSCFVYFYT